MQLQLLLQLRGDIPLLDFPKHRNSVFAVDNLHRPVLGGNGDRSVPGTTTTTAKHCLNHHSVHLIWAEFHIRRRNSDQHAANIHLGRGEYAHLDRKPVLWSFRMPDSVQLLAVVKRRYD